MVWERECGYETNHTFSERTDNVIEQGKLGERVAEEGST